MAHDLTKAKKKRHPQTGTLVGVRAQSEFLARLDAWRKRQGDVPTRPEAIRRLADKALNADA